MFKGFLTLQPIFPTVASHTAGTFNSALPALTLLRLASLWWPVSAVSLIGRKPAMSNFDKILEQVFQQIIADNAMTPEQLRDAAPSIANDIMDQIADEMRKDLRRRAPSTLRGTRRETAGFERRNLQRWRKPFNLIEMILEVAAEVGGKFNTEVRPVAFRKKTICLRR
jgi:hypothetical protein